MTPEQAQAQEALSKAIVDYSRVFEINDTDAMMLNHYVIINNWIDISEDEPVCNYTILMHSDKVEPHIIDGLIVRGRKLLDGD